MASLRNCVLLLGGAQMALGAAFNGNLYPRNPQAAGVTSSLQVPRPGPSPAAGSAAPQKAAGGSAAPQKAAGGSAAPQKAAGGSAAPQKAAGGSAAPQKAAVPEAANPEAANPEAANPEAANPGAANPEAGGKAPQELCDYKVVYGDTCWIIATFKFNTTLEEFYKWNPNVENKDTCPIQPGDVFKTACVEPLELPKPEGEDDKPCTKTYAASNNETCDSVVINQYISQANLKAWNKDIKVDEFGNCNIEEGQEICISKADPTPICNKDYIVKQDDICVKIAKANGMNMDSLSKLNPNSIDNTCFIVPDQKVCVAAENIPIEPLAPAPAAGNETDPFKTIVKPGEDGEQKTVGIFDVMEQIIHVFLGNFTLSAAEQQDPSPQIAREIQDRVADYMKKLEAGDKKAADAESGIVKTVGDSLLEQGVEVVDKQLKFKN